MLFEKTIGTTAAEGKGHQGYFIFPFLLEAEDGAMAYIIHRAAALSFHFTIF